MNIEDVLKKIIKKGETVLDVGGYVGDVAWFMTRCVGPHGKVFSFEPHPEKFKALNAKAATCSNLNAFHCAISNSSSPVELYFGATDKRAQASTICAELATSDRFEEDVHSVEVSATTLDRFCSDHGLHPSVIKIDTEGAEPLVLEGADTILKTMPVLIFELGTEENIPGHLAELRARGYTLYFVDVHRFVSVPVSWDHTVNTETRALRNSIIAFDDDEANRIMPFLANVLAVVPHKHAPLLSGLRVVTLAEALPHFADPKKSFGRKIKHLVRRLLIPTALDDRFPGLVVTLRNLANRIL